MSSGSYWQKKTARMLPLIDNFIINIIGVLEENHIFAELQAQVSTYTYLKRNTTHNLCNCTVDSGPRLADIQYFLLIFAPKESKGDSDSYLNSGLVSSIVL